MAGEKGETVASILKGHKKKYGASINTKASETPDMARLRTGIFEVDYQTGGGLVRGKINEVYGPESSGKTNLALIAIRQNQFENPDKINIFVDQEHAFSKDWATRLGVDCETLHIIQPDFAEQAVDMIEELLYAQDIGIIVLDSIAALVSARELSNSAEKAVVGGVSDPVGKLVRKSVTAMAFQEKEGHIPPTLLLINQTRFKIGVMFGDPETTPGGNSVRFAAALRLRTYGKNIVDTKISKDYPIIKQTTVVVKKNKAPILSTKSMYDMITVPHNGFAAGDCDNWNTIEKMLRSRGQLVKSEEKTGGWIMFGETYKTLKDARAYYYEDREFRINLQEALIQTDVKKMQGEDEDNLIFVDED